MLELRTLKDVKRELVMWGKFWSQQEYGTGVKAGVLGRSPGERVARPTGGRKPFELPVPEHIAAIDARIEKLSPNCKRAIRAYYCCRSDGVVKTWALVGFRTEAEFEFWLRKGVGELV